MTPTYQPVIIAGYDLKNMTLTYHPMILAGDDLLLYVEDRPCTEYVLSHHPKCMKKQVFPMLSAWELPASLAQYGAEGHISNEGEDVVKRLWDLFSEISTKAPKSSDAWRAFDSRNYPAHDFDRNGVSADQLRSLWQNQESIDAATSSAYTKYNTPGDRPKHYMPKNNGIQLKSDEAYFEMHTILFDYADATFLTDFIMSVQEFSLEYRVKAAEALP